MIKCHEKRQNNIECRSISKGWALELELLCWHLPVFSSLYHNLLRHQCFSSMSWTNLMICQPVSLKKKYTNIFLTLLFIFLGGDYKGRCCTVRRKKKTQAIWRKSISQHIILYTYTRSEYIYIIIPYIYTIFEYMYTIIQYSYTIFLYNHIYQRTK
jgi:hypothetical protein